MFFQLDPGTKAPASTRRATTVSVSNTAPDVNLDEVLEALDSDTQAYLRLLLVGAGKGLEGRDEDLGKLLGGLGPINAGPAPRSTRRSPRASRTCATWSTTSTSSPAASRRPTTTSSSSSRPRTPRWARSPSRTRACAARSQLLGPTLTQAESTLNEVADFAAVLGPTFNDLRPFARNLDEANALARDAGQQRDPGDRERDPAVRACRAQAGARTCAGRPASYSSAAPRLTVVGKKLNKLTNMAAYNPDTTATATARTRRDARARRGLPVLGRLARPQRQPALQHGRRQRPVAPDLLHRRLRPAREHPHRRHRRPGPDSARQAMSSRPAPAGARPRQRRRNPVRRRRACCELMTTRAMTSGEVSG